MMFRVNTWNCFGQGQGLSAVTAARAPLGHRLRDEAVGHACADADVVCVQELFSRDAQQFFDGLARYGLSSIVRDDNRACFRSWTFRGTGLGIGARRTPVSTSLRSFSGPCAGWDKLARKGTLHARFLLAEPLHVDVVTVHLQAGTDAVARAVRACQLTELERTVRDIGDEHPFIVCGDFNICGLEPARAGEEYRQLVAALPGFLDLGAEADLPTLDARADSNSVARRFEPQEIVTRVDYVFFRPPARATTPFLPHAIARILDRPLPTEPSLFASDHYGLSATFAY